MVVYLQHHPVFNISEPGKAYIVFDVGAKCQSASFNINLFKGHDLWKKLVGVLLRFRQGKFCIVADVWKIFHQEMVNPRTKGVLRFNCRSNNKDENFKDIPTNVHLFGKVDTHCWCIWALKKTSSNNIVKSSIVPKKSSQRVFRWMII